MKKPTAKRLASKSVDEFVTQYEQARPLYQSFTGKLKSLLEDLLVGDAIKYHVIESRTKDAASFREKITRATKQYDDPLSEITDFSGLRVIVYYLEDVDLVGKLIEREFKIDPVSSVDKGKLLQPNEFGYRSVHYIVEVIKSRSNLLEWRAFSALTAEIQIRTVLQHAWASLSHTLEYKKEQEVPTPFRRKLSRLAGLLELSDEEFSDLRAEERVFSGNIIKELDKGETDLELNSVSLAEFLRKSGSMKFLSDKAKAVGFDISRANSRLSGLITLCLSHDITSIRKLSAILESSKTWAGKYFRRIFNVKPAGVEGWSGDPPFLAELILIRVFSDQISAPDLIKMGWDESIAADVVKTAKKDRGSKNKHDRIVKPS